MALTDYEIATKAHDLFVTLMDKPLNHYNDVYGNIPTTKTDILTDIITRMVEDQDKCPIGTEPEDFVEEMMPKWQERESFVLTIYHDHHGYFLYRL